MFWLQEALHVPGIRWIKTPLNFFVHSKSRISGVVSAEVGFLVGLRLSGSRSINALVCKRVSGRRSWAGVGSGRRLQFVNLNAFVRRHPVEHHLSEFSPISVSLARDLLPLNHHT